MAFNNGLPMGYYPYNTQNYQPIQPTVQQPTTIQNGGIVNVQSEQEARDYLVAQGTSVTFVNGNEQKLYIKTRGFSSLDKPTFKIYSLVEENTEETTPITNYVEKREFEALKADFKALAERIGAVNEQSNANDANA